MASKPVECLAAQALSLSPVDQAKLVERLIARVEPKLPAQVANAGRMVRSYAESARRRQGRQDKHGGR